MKKTYYKLEEAAERLKCSPANLIHLGANDNLPIYALADGWKVDFYGVEVPHSAPYETSTKDSYCKKSYTPIELYEPVQLFSKTLFRFEANPATTERRFIAPAHVYDNDFDRYEYQLCNEVDGKEQNDIAIANCTLVVMPEDIDALEITPENNASTTLAQNTQSEKLKRKAPDAFIAALIRLLVEIAIRATKHDLPFNVSKMPGQKKDLYAVAIKFDQVFDKSLQTFDDYLSGICQFQQGAKPSDFYTKIFPEYFPDQLP